MNVQIVLFGYFFAIVFLLIIVLVHELIILIVLCTYWHHFLYFLSLHEPFGELSIKTNMFKLFSPFNLLATSNISRPYHLLIGPLNRIFGIHTAVRLRQLKVIKVLLIGSLILNLAAVQLYLRISRSEFYLGSYIMWLSSLWDSWKIKVLFHVALFTLILCLHLLMKLAHLYPVV